MAAGYDATVIVAVGQQEQVSQSGQQRNLTSIKRPGADSYTVLQLDLGTLTETEQRLKRLGTKAYWHWLCQIKGLVTHSARTDDRFANSLCQILRNSNLLEPSLLLAYVVQKVACPTG